MAVRLNVSAAELGGYVRFIRQTKAPATEPGRWEVAGLRYSRRLTCCVVTSGAWLDHGPLDKLDAGGGDSVAATTDAVH